MTSTAAIPVSAVHERFILHWGEMGTRWGTNRTVAQIQAESAKLLDEQTNAGWDFCPPGGEDRKSVLARSRGALQDAFNRWPGENILVVTHEGVIKSLLYYLSGRKFLPSEPPLLNSYHLHLLAHDRDGLRLEALNKLALLVE